MFRGKQGTKDLLAPRGPPSSVGGLAQAGSLPADSSASTGGAIKEKQVICKPPSTSACFGMKGAQEASLLLIILAGQISRLL